MQRLKRDPVSLGALGIAVVLLILLAAFNLDRFGGGDTHTAAFRDASGLVAGNEVRIAGVKVGKVTRVSLNGAKVRVTFTSVEPLGNLTTASIRVKTVLGQKFLALEPAGDTPLTREIPLERTASPFDVMQAVTGLAGTVKQIDTAQLAKAFDVLAEAFADTPAHVKASLDGLSRLSRTISSRDEQLRELLSRVNQVTSVLAARDEEFAKLVTDGQLLLAEVARRRDALHRLVEATVTLSDQLTGLVQDNRGQLAPALQQLREVVSVLQRNRDHLAATLRGLAPFLKAFANVTGNGRWFDSYVDGLLQAYAPGGQG